MIEHYVGKSSSEPTCILKLFGKSVLAVNIHDLAA